VFSDRREAGRRLSQRLLGLRKEDPIIVSLPYGALEVADEVADGLQAPLRLMLARKVQAPSTRRTLGAVAEHGAFSVTRPAEVPEPELDEQVALETVELYRRSSVLRRWSPPVAVVRRTAVVVDDAGSHPGIVEAALIAVRAERPGKILFATPLIDRVTMERVRRHVDDVVFLEKVEEPLRAAEHYASYPAIGDDAVGEILRERGM
jgi:putative phosphoribosyl transferase